MSQGAIRHHHFVDVHPRLQVGVGDPSIIGVGHPVAIAPNPVIVSIIKPGWLGIFCFRRSVESCCHLISIQPMNLIILQGFHVLALLSHKAPGTIVLLNPEVPA